MTYWLGTLLHVTPVSHALVLAGLLVLTAQGCTRHRAGPASQPVEPTSSEHRSAEHGPADQELSDNRSKNPPKGLLSFADAAEYVRGLVNRDRKAAGLSPVKWDATAARGGQRHAEDMVRHGFTGHFGTDGSVPEQRYTEAGGDQYVQENALCVFDGVARQLDHSPHFDPALLEKMELMFMSERPPNDGHRKNILKPSHNRVGVGLAKPMDVDQPCVAQEFVDAYGDFDPIPKRAKPRESITITGSVHDPVKFAGLGLARTDLPKPLSAANANKKRTYAVPDTFVMYFPRGFKTKKPVEVKGKRFTLEAPLDDAGRPGLYEVSIWGYYPDSGKQLVPVSLRTIVVR